MLLAPINAIIASIIACSYKFLSFYVLAADVTLKKKSLVHQVYGCWHLPIYGPSLSQSPPLSLYIFLHHISMTGWRVSHHNLTWKRKGKTNKGFIQLGCHFSRQMEEAMGMDLNEKKEKNNIHGGQSGSSCEDKGLSTKQIKAK